MSKCNSLVGEIMGHKYSPRYDYGSSNVENVRGSSAQEVIEFIRATRPATYAYDICERCGHIIKRATE
jgi:hypothetical protein